MIPLTKLLVGFRVMGDRHVFLVKFEVLVVRISMMLHRLTFLLGLRPVYEIFERMDLRYCYGLEVNCQKGIMKIYSFIFKSKVLTNPI